MEYFNVFAQGICRCWQQLFGYRGPWQQKVGTKQITVFLEHFDQSRQMNFEQGFQSKISFGDAVKYESSTEFIFQFLKVFKCFEKIKL